MPVKNHNRMANSVDPDETVLYESSHQDLHCLHRYPVWSAGLNMLSGVYTLSVMTTLSK